MGFNFGGAVIDYDFRNAVGELDPAIRMTFGHESPEELAQKAIIDAGRVAFDVLHISANPADAPIDFYDATSDAFEGLAIGFHEGKTIILGRTLGIDQEGRRETSEALSKARGPMLAFWFNDRSDSYMCSLFRDGQRERWISRGEGMNDEAGVVLDSEPREKKHPHDHQRAVLKDFLGVDFFALQDMKFELFDAM